MQFDAIPRGTPERLAVCLRCGIVQPSAITLKEIKAALIGAAEEAPMWRPALAGTPTQQAAADHGLQPAAVADVPQPAATDDGWQVAAAAAAAVLDPCPAPATPPAPVAAAAPVAGRPAAAAVQQAAAVPVQPQDAAASAAPLNEAGLCGFHLPSSLF